MLNGHHDYPHIRGPAYLFVYFVDCLENLIIDLPTKFFHLINRGPIVMGFVKIIPFHFVHTNGQYGFQPWVDSLGNDSPIGKFVHVEGCCVSIIKDERMPERLCPEIKGLRLADKFKKCLMKLISFEVILFDFLLITAIHGYFWTVLMGNSFDFF